MIKSIKPPFVRFCLCNKLKCLIKQNKNATVRTHTNVAQSVNGNDYSLAFIKCSYRLKHMKLHYRKAKLISLDHP